MDKICIIGVGFVGEHLLTNFNRHYNVVGVDLSSKRVFFLKSKYKYKYKTKTKNISFQSSYDNLQDCNVFLVSVPTLVTKEREIDVSCLHSVRDSLRSIVKPGSLIMIESSVYVGATRELFGEFLERGVYVGFSPERVDPGRVEPPMERIPKVISGLNESSLQVCKNVYEKVFDKVVPVSSCECAEMCKLYENCFRMINIAYVNEISDNIEYVEFVQPKRKFGKTKNNFFSLLDYSIGGIVRHSNIPIRLVTYVGFFFSFVSLCIGFFFLFYKLLFWNSFQLGVAPIVIGTFFGIGLQIFVLGVLGEYINIILTLVRKKPLVVESERINFD